MKRNARSLRVVESAMAVLCLDGTEPDSATAVANDMLHGGGTVRSSANRWFDKCMQFVVCLNGAWGSNVEHSPADGPPLMTLIDFLRDGLGKPVPPEECHDDDVTVTPIMWSLGSELLR